MRTFRTLVALATVVTMGVSTSQVTVAQTDSKPVAIISIAPIERVTKDFSYLMRTCGAQQVGAFGTMMLKQWSDGLDIKRPAGVTVQLIDGQPVPLAFLPLEDRQRFFTALEGAGQFADDLGNGLYAFDAGGRSIFAKDAGKWLFISQQEEDLKSLPADPSTLLGDTPNKYDLAVRIFLQALPSEIRNVAVEQMKQGFERSLAEQRGQSDEERAAAEEMGKASIAQLERLINETEQVLLGVATGPSIARLQVDVGAQFVAGSELAAQTDKLQNMTSDFTGLLIEGAAMTVRSTQLVSEGDKALSKNNIVSATAQLNRQIEDSGSLPQASKTALKKFVSGLMSVLQKTIDSGKFDGGAAVSLEDGKVRAVFGGGVADGTQIEKEVKDLVASLGSGPDVPTFQFDYAKHQGMNLHKVTVPIKTDDPKVTKVFGNELKLVVATGPKAFYLALDPEGDTLIKSALDRVNSAKNVKVSPAEMVVEVGQVLAFMQNLSPNPVLEQAAAQVQQAQGKDKIQVQVTLVPRGAKYEITVDEGVLKGIGAAVQAGQGGGGF